MTLDIDKKHIFPHAGAGRPGFEAAHADTVLGQRRQQFVYRTGPVSNRQDQRRFVFARRRNLLRADNQEAGGIVGIILDIPGADGQPLYLPGFLASHRGRIFILRRQPCGIRIACRVDPCRSREMRQVGIEPFMALGE